MDEVELGQYHQLYQQQQQQQQPIRKRKGARNDFPDVNEIENGQYQNMDNLIPNKEVYEIVKATKYTTLYNGQESENCRLELVRKDGDKEYIRGAATFTKTLFQDNEYMDMKEAKRFFLIYKGATKSCHNFKYHMCLIYTKDKM